MLTTWDGLADILIRFMWTGLLTAVLLGIGFVPAFHASIGIPQFEYLKRRQSLRQNLDGVLVLFGRTSKQEEQLRDGFFQEPYFNYLTGWQQTDAIIILSKTDEMIFLPPRDESTSVITAIEQAPRMRTQQRVTGFCKVASPCRLRIASCSAYRKPADRVYGPCRATVLPCNIDVCPADERAIPDGTGKLDAMREIKSPQEISSFSSSADVSVEAHLAALRRMRPGLFEYQIAATIENTWRERGCERPGLHFHRRFRT